MLTVSTIPEAYLRAFTSASGAKKPGQLCTKHIDSWLRLQSGHASFLRPRLHRGVSPLRPRPVGLHLSCPPAALGMVSEEARQLCWNADITDLGASGKPPPEPRRGTAERGLRGEAGTEAQSLEGETDVASNELDRWPSPAPSPYPLSPIPVECKGSRGRCACRAPIRGEAPPLR